MARIVGVYLLHRQRHGGNTLRGVFTRPEIAMRESGQPERRWKVISQTQWICQTSSRDLWVITAVPVNQRLFHY